MRVFLIILGVIVVLLVAWSCFYTVDPSEFVYVTQFGRHVATHDGVTDGGLHTKLPWPVQAVQRLDRRLQYFDLPETELLTHDPEGKTIDKTLTVVAYVCWRIGDARSVDLFIRRMGTSERAQTILGERLRGQLGALIGKMRTDDLISTDPERVDSQMRELRRRLLEEPGGAGQGRSLQELAGTDYGIEIVDVRLRRTSHPAAVRDSIFERIRSERNKKVADYQSEGARLADDIRSDAERKAQELLADARAEEQRIKSEGERDAERIRNEAQGKDAEFYAFLRKLEEYQRILGDNKTMLLLSSHGELFDVLFKPPRPNGGSSPTITTGGSGGEKPPAKPAEGGPAAPPTPGKSGGQ